MSRRVGRLAAVTVICLGGVAAAADPLAHSPAHPLLGRLFFSAPQRAALDARRGEEAPLDVAAPDDELALPAVPVRDSRMVLNGIVRRERGTAVLWINGVEQAAPRPGRSVGRIHGVTAEGRAVRLDSGRNHTVELVPGQFWDPGRGEVGECLGCRLVPRASKPVGENEPLATTSAVLEQPEAP